MELKLKWDKLAHDTWQVCVGPLRLHCVGPSACAAGQPHRLRGTARIEHLAGLELWRERKVTDVAELMALAEAELRRRLQAVTDTLSWRPLLDATADSAADPTVRWAHAWTAPQPKDDIVTAFDSFRKGSRE